MDLMFFIFFKHFPKIIAAQFFWDTYLRNKQKTLKLKKLENKQHLSRYLRKFASHRVKNKKSNS